MVVVVGKMMIVLKKEGGDSGRPTGGNINTIGSTINPGYSAKPLNSYSTTL
jgi:hypothetical protein